MNTTTNQKVVITFYYCLEYLQTLIKWKCMFIFAILYFDGILLIYLVNVLFVLPLLGIFSFQIKIIVGTHYTRVNFSFNLRI